MKTLFSESPPAAIENLAHLAAVLMTVDHSGRRFDADQYRRLIEQLTSTLKAAPPGPALETVLNAFPATAALYENLNYEHAGLCRSPLENSLESERQAVAAIANAMKRDSIGPATQSSSVA